MASLCQPSLSQPSLNQPCDHFEAAPASSGAFHLRPAAPADVPALMLLKHKMMIEERAPFGVQGSALDWLHQGFGPTPTYSAKVVENEAAIVVGMIIFNERRIAGWPRSSLYVQDLYVEPEYRRQGIGRALLTQVVRDARDRNAAYVELNVREESPARRLYDRSGFQAVPHCLMYVLGGQTLLDFASSAAELLALAGM